LNITDMPLPEIPVIDVTGDVPTLGIAEAAEDRLEALFAAAEAHYGRRFIAVADTIVRRWGRRNSTPYRGEIRAFASRLSVPGGWFLNVGSSFTGITGIQADPDTGAMQMLRVLDHPLSGLGRGLVAAWQQGPSGPYLSLTWPGFAGVVTGIAGGRFAAAFNQAPLPNRRLGYWGDWTASRLGIWRSREMPPTHLLRQVFEHCTSYSDACHALIHGPICVSAIFTVVGTRPGEGCVIERTTQQAWVHPAPTVAAAKHWQASDLQGRTRADANPESHLYMTELLNKPLEDGFGWLTPPLLNTATRLAATLHPASGQVTIQGHEATGPATLPLSLVL
jgi:hypothetical protein